MVRRLACVLALALACWLGWRAALAPQTAQQAALPVEPAPEARSTVVAEPEPVSAPALAESSDSAREPLAATAPPEKKRRLTPGEATLWVEVRSADTGAPVAGAQVAITRAGVLSDRGDIVPALEGELGKIPRTGADGLVRFHLRARAYLLHVSWGAMLQARKEVEVAELADDEERTLRIEIPTGDEAARFLGRVLDQRSSAPIAGAEVLLFQGESWGVPWPIYQDSRVVRELAQTTTDAEGRFAVLSSSSEHTMVRVRAPGFVSAYLPVVQRHSELAHEVELRVARSASLIGTVLKDGGPAPGIDVCLSTETGQLVRHARTQSDGRCRIEGVPAEVSLHVRLDRSKEGFETPPALVNRNNQDSAEVLVLAPGEVRECRWTLGALCTLRGIAHDSSGRAAPDLWLHLRHDDPAQPDEEPVFFMVGSEKYPDLTRTDAEGRFLIEELASGTWWLAPEPEWTRGRPSQDAIVPLAQRITIPEGATEVEVELEIHRGLSIEGKVVANGAPIEGAIIASPAFSAFISSDARGDFRFGPLVPGEYELTADKSGFACTDPASYRAGDSGVELRLERGGTLRVRVVDGTGIPLPEFHKTLLLREETGAPMGLGKRVGEFQVWSELHAAKYSLVSTAEDRIGWLRNITVEAGSDAEQTLVVAEPAARLLVRSADEKLPYCQLKVLHDGVPVGWRTMSGKDPGSLNVPPGPCELVLVEGKTAKWKQTLSAIAIAGQETEIVFPPR